MSQANSSTASSRVVDAKLLFNRLLTGRGHTIKRGQAPEGFLEVWPDGAPVIWHISTAEHFHLDCLIEAEKARRRVNREGAESAERRAA